MVTFSTALPGTRRIASATTPSPRPVIRISPPRDSASTTAARCVHHSSYRSVMNCTESRRKEV